MKDNSERVRGYIFPIARLVDAGNVKAARELGESHFTVNIKTDNIVWKMLRMIDEDCITVLGIE